jgi:hypothetical protein
MLARKAFAFAAPASAADARGGANGAVAAVGMLAGGLGEWLGELRRQLPAVAERCGA